MKDLGINKLVIFVKTLVEIKFKLALFILLEKTLTVTGNVIGRKFTAHYSSMLHNKQKK